MNKAGRKVISDNFKKLGHKVARKTLIDAFKTSFFRSSTIRMKLADVNIKTITEEITNESAI